MSTTQVASVPQGAGSASIPTAPHRAQREGSSNLGTFGVRQAIFHSRS
jgi:hypothetical protein